MEPGRQCPQQWFILIILNNIIYFEEFLSFFFFNTKHEHVRVKSLYLRIIETNIIPNNALHANNGNSSLFLFRIII